MNKFSAAMVIIWMISWNAYAQHCLKTAEDTAFVLERVYFPQLQINLSVSFLTSDFLPGSNKQIRFSEIDSLKKLITKDAGNGDHYLQLSPVYLEFHLTREADSLRSLAKNIFIDNLVANAADTHAVRNLANIFLGDSRFDLAKAYFDELTRIAPSASAGWSGLALIHLAAYDFKTSVSHMEKALQAEPGNMDNYCQMANILMMKSVFDLNAYDSTVLDTLSFRRIIDTRFVQDALLAKPGNPTLLAVKDALTLTAIMYKSFIDNAGVVTGDNDTIKFSLKPDIAKDLALIGERMAERANGAFRGSVFPYTCLMLAAFLQNDTEKALEWFEKGVKYNPRSQSLYENMTGIASLAYRKDIAYRLQLKLDSIHPTASNFLMTGFFYFLDDKYEESKTWTEKVLKADPASYFALMGLAAIYAKKLELSNCAFFLDKAAAIDDNDPDVLLLTAILFLFDNSPNMARQTLTALAATGRNVREAVDMLNRFFP